MYSCDVKKLVSWINNPSETLTDLLYEAQA